MKVKAVIFDLDNTLCDRKLCLKSFSYKFIEDYSSYIEMLEKENIIRQIKVSDRNGYRNKEELFKELLEVLVWKSKPSVSELVEYWKREFINHTTPTKGMESVLTTLKNKGYKLGVITNGTVNSQHRKIQKLNISDYFDSIIISEAVNIKKPDKRIFQLSLEELEVKPEEAIYVGDHPVNDVIGALEAGINAVWLKGEDEWDTDYAFPNKPVTSLEELLDIVS